MRRYLKVVLITAAIIIATAPLLALAFVYVGLHGGIRGTILSLKPRPNLERADIKETRTKLRAEIESAFVHIMAHSEFIAYETSSQDICHDGTHNTLRVDQFAHRCTLRLTRFYGFDDSFRDKMIEFEHRVLSEGWNVGRWGGSMENLMTNYYDVRHLRNNPSMAVDFVLRPHGYYSDSGQLTMRIEWAERASQRNGVGVNSLNVVQTGFTTSFPPPFFRQLKLHEGHEVLAKVTRDHKYVLAVAIYGHYFQD